MKKIFAILALAATGAAFAQSNVTLYGNLDQTLYHASNSGKSVNATNSNGGTTSLWGLTGKEDLGNGLSVQFDLKSEVTLATGQASSTSSGVNTAAGTTDNNNSNTGFFNRGAWVGLNSGIGSFKLGRQNDAVWEQAGRFNNTGINSLGWNGLTATATSFGTTASTFNGTTLTGSPFGTSTASVHNPSAQGTGIAFWSGGSYETPTIGGFKGKVMTGGKTSYSQDHESWNRTAGSLTYDQGAVSAAYALSVINDGNGATAAKVSLLAGSYKLGNYKFTAGQQKTNFSGSWASLGNDLTVNGVGVGYTTGKWEYNAGYTVLTDDVNSTYKTTQTAATARYNLSKRTSVYGGYGHGKNEGANNKVGVIFGGAALATSNTTNDGLIFGFRHQF